MKDEEIGNTLLEIEHLKSENARLHHLTNVLIQHIWKSGKDGLPLKDIDQQMKLFDEKNENVDYSTL